MSELTKEHFEKVIEKLGTKLTKDMEGLETKLMGEMEGLDTKLTGKIGDLDSKLMGEIEKLAICVNEGFTDVMERLEKVDVRLDGIDSRLEGVDARLDGIDTSVKFLQQGQENIELRLTSLAPKFEVKELQQAVVTLQSKKQT